MTKWYIPGKTCSIEPPKLRVLRDGFNIESAALSLVYNHQGEEKCFNLLVYQILLLYYRDGTKGNEMSGECSRDVWE
jgi:hypothetical protein